MLEALAEEYRSPSIHTTTEKKVLSVSCLKKSYGAENKVLDDVNFELDSGEFVAVIGRSGAGKSTLLHCLNGSKKITSGQITHHKKDGKKEDISQYNQKNIRLWKRQCGMIFQDFCLVPRLDVITNVILGRLGYESTFSSLLKIFKNKDKEKAIELLDWLKILPHALQRAENLSGGQQQRVAICRALMQDPAILLADEPVASLDPKNTTRIMEALQKVTERNITVMVNLHSIELVHKYCSRVIGLSHGKVIFDGQPKFLTEKHLNQLYGDDVSRIH